MAFQVRMAKDNSGVGRRFSNKINFDAVCSHHIGSDFCKSAAVIAAVVGNGNL